ncbi:MAG: polymer-forming cytoskeletal protein [Candidatus Omnitrophica bacterium]|nr:polymer-forming cytoskeletal protein [Candidatus Omnitrophota bacterium]
MFRGRRENEVPETKTIEISAQMQGTLSFKDPVNLKMNGNFQGTLDVQGTLTIGNSAIVEAEILGENVVIAGKVRGNIIAKKMLVLMPTSVVTGDISTPRLNIVEGAVFHGRCQMMEDTLTVDEVARYLEIEASAIIELASTGKIPALRNGNEWQFERSKIDNWASTGQLQ